MSTMNKSYNVSNGDSVFEGFDEDVTDDDVFDNCGTQLVKCFFNFIPTIPTVIIIPYFVTASDVIPLFFCNLHLAVNHITM